MKILITFVVLIIFPPNNICCEELSIGFSIASRLRDDSMKKENNCDLIQPPKCYKMYIKIVSSSNKFILAY